MAFRIGDLIEEADFYFSRKNSFHGSLKLKGREALYLVELAGAPCKELRGKRIVVFANPDIATDPPDMRVVNGLHYMQKGVAGEMTAGRWVRYHGCAPAELARRAKTGETPPFEWKRLLYFEWFSANGRVVCEMVAPNILVAGSDSPECIDWEPLQLPDNPPHLPADNSDSPADVTLEARQAFPYGESMERLRQENPLYRGCKAPDDLSKDSSAGFDENAPQDENPLQWNERSDDADLDVSPEPSLCGDQEDSLDAYLEGLSRETDSQAGLGGGAAALPWDPDDPFIREMDYMEEVVAGNCDDDDLLSSIIPERPDIGALSEEEAELKVKVILAAAALYNIAFHICDHFTAHDMLRLIYDHYAEEVHIHPGFIGTGWTTNYDTFDHCKRCDEEMTAEWEEEQQERGLTEEDPPF